MKPLTKWPLILLVMLAASVIPILVISTWTQPGLYLEFRAGGEVSDASLCVYLDITMPEHAERLAEGCFESVPVVFIPYEKMRPYIQRWWSTLSSQGVSANNIMRHEIGLLLRAFIVNTTTGELVYDIHDSIPLSISDFTSPKIVHYVISPRRDAYQVMYEKKTGLLSIKGAVEPVEALNTGIQRVEYIVKYRVVPENMTVLLPSDYFTSRNNVLYMKVPVLIVYNEGSVSGIISSSISTLRSDAGLRFDLVFTTGSLTDQIRNGIIPAVNLYKGGSTWGGGVYFFGINYYTSPGSVKWAYIWGRPVFEIANKYYCYRGEECLLLGEEARAYISDVMLNGSYIQGGSQDGWPHSVIMDSFFNGTSLQRLILSGGALSNGYLDVNETLVLFEVTSFYDVCGSDFEIGLPVGSVLAMGACYAIGLGVGTPACQVARAFAGAFMVPMRYDGGFVFISGTLANYGRIGDVGSDKPEAIYVAISRYTYKQSSCSYNVPAGLYFKCS